MQYIQTKTVYIDRDELIEIKAIEHDVKTRFIDFKFIAANKILDISNCIVRVYALNQKGNEIFNNLNIIDGVKGIARLELTDALLVPGTTEYMLKIRTENGGILSSNRFNLIVDKDLMTGNAIEGTNEYKALDEALKTVGELNSMKVSIGENAKTIEKNKQELDKKTTDNSNTIIKNREEYDSFKNSVLASEGSENIIQNSSFKKDTIKYEGWKAKLAIEAGFGCRVLATETGVSNLGILTPAFDLEANKTYTVSFLVGSMYNTPAINYVYLMGTQSGNINLNVNIPIDASTTKQKRINFKFSTNQNYKGVKLLIGYDGSLIEGQGFTINKIMLSEGDLLKNYSEYPHEIYSKKINVDENQIVFGDGEGTYSSTNNGDLEYTTGEVTHKYPVLKYIASFSIPAGNPGTVNVKLPKEFTKRKETLTWGVVPKGYYYNTSGNFFPFHVAVNAKGEAYEQDGYMYCPVEGYCRIQNGENSGDVQPQSINAVVIALA